MENFKEFEIENQQVVVGGSWEAASLDEWLYNGGPYQSPLILP